MTGLQLINKDEFIYVDTWEKLSRELEFEFCSPFELDLLFKGDEKKPSIVISGCGDAVLCEQAEHFPAKDLAKYLSVIDWNGISRMRGKYPSFQIGPAIQEGRCFPDERYSLKTDRYTWGTFNSFPSWLEKLYMTNVNIDHRRVELLPFGLNTDGPGASYIHPLQTLQKKEMLYCNMQWNSQRRFEVKSWAEMQRWITNQNCNLPVKQYLEEVAAHRFNLCTIGNGYDQYRIYETLYLGSIPIVEESTWAKKLQKMGFPLLVVNDMTMLTPDFLNRYWEVAQQHPWNYEALTVSYWRQRLQREASEI